MGDTTARRYKIHSEHQSKQCKHFLFAPLHSPALVNTTEFIFLIERLALNHLFNLFSAFYRVYFLLIKYYNIIEAVFS